VSALCDQFERGGVERDIRLIAAQGALPLGPADLFELLVLLTEDTDAEVAETARESLRGYSVEEALPFAASRTTAEAVLAWFVTHRPEPELRGAALQNPTLPDAAIEGVVAALPETLAELVVINQTRLLRRTSLLEALEGNACLNADQRRRLRELRESFHVGTVAPVSALPPPPSAPLPLLPTVPEPAPHPAAEPAGEAVEEVEQEADCTGKLSTQQRIHSLNTAQKLVAALKGTREERTILIRDPNRLVWSAVLDSPRITEAEVEAIAGMKNVADDALRVVGNKSEWTNVYAVRANLVRNPRTPLAISLQHLPSLTAKDLKSISVDRNVPEAVRKAALRFVRPDRAKG
jgi:hypothetical protein